MFDETYSLRLVTQFLKEHGIDFEHSSANVGILFNDHGCRVKVNDVLDLSIQTHPDVTGTSFAETALMNTITNKMVDDGTHGYDDIRRWDTPDELFQHIKIVMDIKALNVSSPSSD